MPDNAESGSRNEFGKLIELVYLVVILCACIWAKEFLLPIVLAILIIFLLAPVVSRLERLGLHPVLAVLSVAAIAFAVIGGLCATITMQALDLANSLPKYQDNIHARWMAIQQGPPGPLNLAFRNVGSLIDDLSKATAPAKPSRQVEPMKVQIVSGSDAAVAFIRN